MSVDYKWYERLLGVKCRELIFSAFIWLAFLLTPRDLRSFVLFLSAWIVMAVLTGIAGHIGLMTRMECGDIRFMWLSLYGKLPRWTLWIFWLLLLPALLRPTFGIPAVASVGLSFYRGYHFVRVCTGWRIITMIDISIRLLAGILLIVV